MVSSVQLNGDSVYNQVSQLEENALFNLYKETESQEGDMIYKNITIEIQRELDERELDY